MTESLHPHSPSNVLFACHRDSKKGRNCSAILFNSFSFSRFMTLGTQPCRSPYYHLAPDDTHRRAGRADGQFGVKARFARPQVRRKHSREVCHVNCGANNSVASPGIRLCRSSCKPWGGQKKTWHRLLAPPPPIRIGVTGQPVRILLKRSDKRGKHREIQNGNYPI